MELFKRCLLATLVGFLYLALAESARADLILTGEFSGWDFTTTFVYSDYTPVGFSQGFTPDTFAITIDVTTDLVTYNGFSQPDSLTGYDSQSVSGSLFLGNGYFGADVLDFSVFFLSLPADGVLDNSNSSAGYQASYYGEDDFGNGTDDFVTFSTNPPPSAPEPSSVVLGALGILIILVFARMSGLRAKLLARRA